MEINTDQAKEIFKKIDAHFGKCWYTPERKEGEEREDCTSCNGFLYVEQGGDVVDCPSCDGTGEERPENQFNYEKFGELFVEEGLGWDVAMMAKQGFLPEYEEPEDDIYETDDLPF